MTSSGFLSCDVERRSAKFDVIPLDELLDLVDWRALDDCVTLTRVSSCKCCERNEQILSSESDFKQKRNAITKFGVFEFRDDLMGMNDFFSPSVGV